MKKIISLTLALLLVLSLGITAFADTEITINPTGAGSQNVTGTYVAGVDGGTIYGVDISWGSMAFTYTDASKGTWQPDSHIYTGAKAAAWSWTDGDNEIKVTNHSNDGITVTPSYNKDTGFENASMTFDNASLTLATADNGENGAAGTATTGTITVTPGGSIPEGTSGKIGTITLSIAGASSSGSDTPSAAKATITGLTITIDGVTYNSDNNSTSEAAPAKITRDSTVSITVSGENFSALNDEHCVIYKTDYAVGVSADYDWTVDTANNTSTRVFSASFFADVTSAYEIQYTNHDVDDNANFIGSGVWIIYEG